MERIVVEDLVKVMTFPRAGIFSRVIVKTALSNVTLMCLSKGTQISEHTTLREASVSVLKGTGTFSIGSRRVRMKPGVVIFLPKSTPHALHADTDCAILLSLFGAPQQHNEEE